MKHPFPLRELGDWLTLALFCALVIALAVQQRQAQPAPQDGGAAAIHLQSHS